MTTWDYYEWEDRPSWGDEPFLRQAMLVWLRGMGKDAVAVQGYREFSYDIGYCETCHDIVTEVKVFYNAQSGSLRAHDYYGELGELIRELTPANA